MQRERERKRKTVSDKTQATILCMFSARKSHPKPRIYKETTNVLEELTVCQIWKRWKP